MKQEQLAKRTLHEISWDLVIDWKPPPFDRAELGVFSELPCAEFS